MASLKISACHIVFTNGTNFSVISKGTAQVKEISLTDSSNRSLGEDSKTKGDGGQRNGILACEFSPTGKYFAVCDDQKQLHIYESSPDWQLTGIRTLARRCIAIAFTKQEQQIVLADKAGDAYIYSTSSDEQNGQLILGHISMLTDVVLTNNDKFVVTSDRDEKIRISCYPNAYNIHSFCLGHTEFVSKILYIESHDVLISGSGDGTVRLWNTEGEQLDCMECRGLKIAREDAKNAQQLDKGTVKCLVYNPHLHLVVVAFTGLSVIEFYKLHLCENMSLKLLGSKELTVEPWDIQFDVGGVLWVLTPDKTSPVELYKVEEMSDGTELIEVDKSERGDWSLGVDSINNNWKFFEEALQVESLFSKLWKGKIDNMPEYLEKKQQRLQEKNKDVSSSEAEPAEKKAKIDP